MKEVLKIAVVTISMHKEAHPSDSEDYDEIGLSSEEEAEDLEPDKYVRRKFDKPAPPPEPQPRLPQLPGSDPSPGSAPSTDPVPPAGETTTLQVPVSAVKQLHTLLGQIIQGKTPHCRHFRPYSFYRDRGGPLSGGAHQKGRKAVQDLSEILLQHRYLQEAHENSYW